MECLVVGLGGFLGTVLRYLVGQVPVKENFAFPVKTFCINIAGAFLIGVVTALASRNSALDPRWVLFLKVGICGGFTTFSSFALETSDLLKGGAFGLALVYVCGSVLLGVLAVLLAQALVR